MSKIVALLPSYNEEVALGSVILRTKKYVDNIIVIDDGSYDKTSEISKLAGAKVIKHETNLGKGAALKTGFEASKDYDIIVTIDSDAQHNPDEIPKLIKPLINNDADIVNGSRYINGTDKNTPSYRRVGQKVLDTATNMSTGLKLTDSQSGFRAFSKKTFNCFQFKDTGFGVESEMLSDAAEHGFRITEVEIGVRYDVDGSTKNPVSHGVKVLVKIIKDMELRRPLYYFTVPGIIIFIIGSGLSLLFLHDYIIGVSVNIGPTIISVMLSLFGTFFMFTGIILDSISRMLCKYR